MRTLAVLFVFLFSLLALGKTLSTTAHPSNVAIVPASSSDVSAPEWMDEGSDELLAKAKEQKHHKDGGDDTRKEEDFSDDQQAALQALDPVVFDGMLRLRLAAAKAP